MTRKQLLDRIAEVLSFTELTLIRGVCAGDISPGDAAKNILTLTPAEDWARVAAVPFDHAVEDALAFRYAQLRKGRGCPSALAADVLRDPAAH